MTFHTKPSHTYLSPTVREQEGEDIVAAFLDGMMVRRGGESRKIEGYNRILDAFAAGATYLKISRSLLVSEGMVLDALRWGRAKNDPRAVFRNYRNTAEARQRRSA